MVAPPATTPTPATDKNLPTNKVIASKIATACRNHAIPEQYYEQLTISASLDRLSQIGLTIKRDVVMCTRYGSPFQGQLIHGDILIAVNNHALNDDQAMVKNVFNRVATSGGKVTVNAVRLKRRCPVDASLPQGFEKQEGFEYEWVMLYYLKGMNLGLAMKEIDGKLYVGLLKPEGYACMGLSIGERIVDVDGNIVNDIKTAVDIMNRQMDKNGMIRICVESPKNDMLRNMTRVKIAKVCEADEPIDNPPPEETLAFAERGVRAMKASKGEPKSILKGSGTKSSSSSAKGGTLKFNEKTIESGILIEVQSKLMVTVPPAKTVESEAAMSGK